MGVSLHTHLMLKDFQRNQENYETTLKEFFNPFEKVHVYSKAYFDNFLNQIKLNELGTDTLFKGENSTTLFEKGYAKTTKNNYPFVFPNNAFMSAERGIKCNYNIEYDFKYKGYDIRIFFRQNTLSFYVNEEEMITVTFPENYEVLDAYHFDNGYLDIILNINGQKKLIKTHLALDFFEFEYNMVQITHLNDMEAISKIDLNFAFNRVIESNHNYLIVVINNIKYKIYLTKRYFFEDLGINYFNVETEEEYKEYLKNYEENTVEHIFLYDWIDLMGFNFLKDLNTFKFNSFKYRLLQNKQLHFDNTSNGALNLVNLNTKKDYYINSKINGIDIVGNFVHEYKKGNYSIHITCKNDDDGECRVAFALEDDNNIIKSLVVRTKNRIALFCNLKFSFTKLEYGREHSIIDINVKDDYNVFFDYLIEKENYDHLDTTVIDETMSVYRALNKTEINKSQPRKKEVANVNSQDSNLFISNFIQSEDQRVSILDKKINFVKENNTPSSLWIEGTRNENYFLADEEKHVTKRLNIKMKEEKAFESNNLPNFLITLKNSIK